MSAQSVLALAAGIGIGMAVALVAMWWIGAQLDDPECA